MARTKVIIMGAAGMDFHTFNTVFRDNEDYEVVAFTATQIPNIEGRAYPAVLANRKLDLYPDGIPIESEDDLVDLIHEHGVEEVVLAYSDLAHEDVMHKASIVNAAGAGFRLMGTDAVQIKSSKPVISVCAVRTGCGKSQITRRILEILKDHGKRAVAVRHPMPYGDLARQEWQRFADYSDLDRHRCTIEEREEYEPHIDNGHVVFAGVDYGRILEEAEKEADVILWDGGNNDMSFYKSDLRIVVVDPHRAGDEILYYPGETNLRRADVIVINKIDTAHPEGVEMIRENIRSVNPTATVIDAASPVFVEDFKQIVGKRVLVVEDGPTVTHGGMEYGAGWVAAEKFGAGKLVSPMGSLKGSLVDTFEKYTHLEYILPAMGYGEQQIRDLEATINAVDCDMVIAGTPIDLNRVLSANKPILRVRYEIDCIGKPDLEDIIEEFLERL